MSLGDLDSSISTIAQPKESSMPPILSTDPEPLPTLSNRPQPYEAYMLEVTIDKSEAGIGFQYTQYWHKAFVTSGDPSHEQFLKWISQLIKNPVAGKKFSYFDRTPGLRKPTKMSFNCKNLVYLVFKLDPNINWRFSADAAPISMDKIWKGKDVFFNATNLNTNGDEATPVKENTQKYAYMIANCPKGTPLSGQEIEARFNLHVDFVEGSDNDDPYVPVIIDPDVRNPGGNGP